MMQPGIRILVVDDEPAIRRALRAPLLELGFQVAEASRGEEALQALRRWGVEFLTDPIQILFDARRRYVDWHVKRFIAVH